MIYRAIELAKYPTIGEVVFPDEPNVVYWNKYALPSCKNDRYYPLMAPVTRETVLNAIISSISRDDCENYGEDS